MHLRAWVSGKTDSPRPPLSIPRLPALSRDLEQREFVLQYPVVLHGAVPSFLQIDPWNLYFLVHRSLQHRLAHRIIVLYLFRPVLVVLVSFQRNLSSSDVVVP